MFELFYTKTAIRPSSTLSFLRPPQKEKKKVIQTVFLIIEDVAEESRFLSHEKTIRAYNSAVNNFKEGKVIMM